MRKQADKIQQNIGALPFIERRRQADDAAAAPVSAKEEGVGGAQDDGAPVRAQALTDHRLAELRACKNDVRRLIIRLDLLGNRIGDGTRVRVPDKPLSLGNVRIAAKVIEIEDVV